MQLVNALSCYPARASPEIKLDMRVDYIVFMKPWIEKLKDSTHPRNSVSTHLAGLAASVKTHTAFSEEIL